MTAGSRNSASAPRPSAAPPPDGSANGRRTESGDRATVAVGAREVDASGVAAAPSFKIEAGARIGGKYRLTRLIGAGGMGAVWAAVNEALGSEVALKFLLGRSHSQREHAARFAAEAKMAAAIKHRFVVDIFDYGSTEDGTPYMVLELLEGQELAQRLHGGPALTLKELVRLCAQCLSGLEAIHRAGIVHRDLKPENVFVISDSDGMFPKLLDFGVAISSEPEPEQSSGGTRRLTKAGVTLGTPTYMSPEQLRARRDLDGRADLFAMGVIMFEALVGAPPFPDDNAADLMVKIATLGMPRLCNLRPELGTALSDVLARALAPSRDQRYATAAEMRDALNRLLPQLPDAHTIVQDRARTAGYGNHTALVLQAAQNAFGGAPTRAWQGQNPGQAPAWRRWAPLAAGALALVILATWAMSGRHSDAGASKTPAASAPQAGQHPPLQPTATTAVPAAEAAPATQLNQPATATAGAPRQNQHAATEPTAEPEDAHAGATSSVHRPAGTAAHASRARAKPKKKLFRSLDF